MSRNYFAIISLGCGRRLRQRDSAAARLRRLRLGCCADFFPPLLPILRRKSLTAAGVVGMMLAKVLGIYDSVKGLLFSVLPFVSVPLGGGGAGAPAGGGEAALRGRGENPLALALAMPAALRCRRAAGDMRLRLPALRLPRERITADMVSAEGVGAVGAIIGLRPLEAKSMPSW